ncbi:MAG TPA: SDR family NAD(P)-dependent oxidoreductase [Bacteroidia bacterium]|nr:SDR family NAD(P)-dependent oxidoreductase [Bacteroidia bacterium]
MNPSQNTILITGGATGIGLAMAEQLLKAGSEVIVCGRRMEMLNEAKQKFPALHIEQTDLSKKESREKFAKYILEKMPSINMLINNAGIQNETDITNPDCNDSMQEEVGINFIAPVHLASLFISHLKTKKEAAIINITSGLAFAPLAIVPVYCATKAALHSVTLSLRHQLRNTSIKVFEIAPPIVDTKLDRGGRDRRGVTDRGISAQEFALAAMEAIKNDTLEAAIGMAAGLREKREAAFPFMNK